MDVRQERAYKQKKAPRSAVPPLPWPARTGRLQGRVSKASRLLESPTGSVHHLSHGQREPVGFFFPLSLPEQNAPSLSKRRANLHFLHLARSILSLITLFQTLASILLIACGPGFGSRTPPSARFASVDCPIRKRWPGPSRSVPIKPKGANRAGRQAIWSHRHAERPWRGPPAFPALPRRPVRWIRRVI
jgi:hypothetical protein